VGLWRYRRVDRYDYPFLKCGVIVFGMIASYVVYDSVAHWEGMSGGPLSLAILLWFGWFVVLFGSSLRELANGQTWFNVKTPSFLSRDHGT